MDDKVEVTISEKTKTPLSVTWAIVIAAVVSLLFITDIKSLARDAFALATSNQGEITDIKSDFKSIRDSVSEIRDSQKVTEGYLKALSEGKTKK